MSEEGSFSRRKFLAGVAVSAAVAVAPKSLSAQSEKASSGGLAVLGSTNLVTGMSRARLSSALRMRKLISGKRRSTDIAMTVATSIIVR